MADANGIKKNGLKGKATPTISVAAILGVAVQGFLGYQENKTKTAQANFTYQVVREMKEDVDETLEKVDELLEREARLEGVVDGLRDAIAVLQDRRIRARDRSEAVEEILRGLEAPIPEPEPEEDEAVEASSFGAGGGGWSDDDGDGIEATAPAMGKRKGRPKRSPASVKAALPDKLPESVQAVEQAQQQLQEIFE